MSHEFFYQYGCGLFVLSWFLKKIARTPYQEGFCLGLDDAGVFSVFLGLIFRFWSSL